MAEIMHKTGFHGFNNSDSHTKAIEENKFTCLSFLDLSFLKKLPPFENVFKGNRMDILSWHKYWYGQIFNVFLSYYVHIYFLDFYYCIFVMQHIFAHFRRRSDEALDKWIATRKNGRQAINFVQVNKNCIWMVRLNSFNELPILPSPF